MHDQPPRLVDDDDVAVLVDDIQRDILAGGLGGDRLRDVDCDRIARGDMISGVADGSAFDRCSSLVPKKSRFLKSFA
jgi:hypothetical protein